MIAGANSGGFCGSRSCFVYLVAFLPLVPAGCAMYQPTTAVPGMSYMDAKSRALEIGRPSYLTDIQVREKVVDFVFQRPNNAAKPSSCKAEDINPTIADTVLPPYILEFGSGCEPHMAFWDLDQAKRLADALYVIREQVMQGAMETQSVKGTPALFGSQGVAADR